MSDFLGVSISEWIGVVGTAASMLSLLVAGLQTIRLRELKRREVADVWLALRMVVNQLELLESKEQADDRHVSRVYQSTADLFHVLLRQAVLLEPRFNGDVIQKWKEAGKLTSEWQIKQARHYLETGAIRQRGFGFQP